MAAPSPIVKYLDQDYQTLKAEYLKCGKLFEDPTFPADDSSLYYNHSISHGLQWYRPKVC